MKSRIAVFVLLVGILGVGAWFQLRESGERLSGFQAPDFTLSDLEGRRYTLSELRGKVVFLNLWATWCPPCRAEMPSMEKLHRQLAGEGFIMLAVSEDADGASVVEPFARELGLTFPILLDPTGNIPHRYGITGYPETFIIDRNGSIVKHQIGPEDWSDPRIVQFLQDLIKPKSSTNTTAIRTADRYARSALSMLGQGA